MRDTPIQFEHVAAGWYTTSDGIDPNRARPTGRTAEPAPVASPFARPPNAGGR